MIDVVCNECGNSLDLEWADITTKGDINLRVTPCETCLEKEYEKGELKEGEE